MRHFKTIMTFYLDNNLMKELFYYFTSRETGRL